MSDTTKQNLKNFRDTALGKQDKLIAGENITIENNVISAAIDEPEESDALTIAEINSLLGW